MCVPYLIFWWGPLLSHSLYFESYTTCLQCMRAVLCASLARKRIYCLTLNASLCVVAIYRAPSSSKSSCVANGNMQLKMICYTCSTTTNRRGARFKTAPSLPFLNTRINAPSVRDLFWRYCKGVQLMACSSFLRNIGLCISWARDNDKLFASKHFTYICRICRVLLFGIRGFVSNQRTYRINAMR